MAIRSAEEGAWDYWTKCLQTRLVIVDGTSDSASSKETIDHARNALFVELKALKDLIMLTITHVNNLSITARLPSEVLSHVFAALSDCDPPPKPGDQLGEERRLGWIIVTHVCRRWRQVALSTPALWTNVGAPQTGPWMNEMLTRSKQAPFTLSACLDQGRKVCDVVLKALTPDFIWRMKDLYLSEGLTYFRDHTYSIEVLLASLRHPAPMLESLTLDNVAELDAIPPDIFACHLPSLRHFVARDIRRMELDTSFIRNLTDLELQFQFEASPSLVSLLTLLRNSPALETLKIIDGESDSPEEHLPDGGKVSLPYLKTLLFKGQVNTKCTQLLASLTIPQSTRKKFHFLNGEIEEISCVIPLVFAFIGTNDPSTLPAPISMRIECDKCYGGMEVLVYAWFEQDSGASDGAPFFLQWNILSLRDRIPLVQRLLTSFDLRKVTYLILESTDFDNTVYDAVKESFIRMPAVKQIRMKGIGISPLLGLLETTHIRVSPDSRASNVNRKASKKKASLLFPKLTYLRIVAAPFDMAMLEHKGADPFGNLLRSVLEKRSALGARIKTLSIKNWGGNEAMLDGFREHVGILLH